MTSNVKALVLAAGLGTRLKPLTDRLPKCLVTIAGRPLLDYWVDTLFEAGVSEARVNTHAHAGQVRAFIQGVNDCGRLNVTECYEPTLLGSAGTVAANLHFADDATEIILVYADNLSDVNLSEMLAFHRSHDDPFTILLFRAPVPEACGIVELDGAGRVVSFEEKPRQPRGDLANGGIYIVSPDAYREMASSGAFDLGRDVLPRFVGRMRGWHYDGYHRDIGTHEALAEAEQRYRSTGRKRRPAVFLDRDGTLIEHVHYLSDPAQVRLVPGGAEAVRRIKDAGFACVVVTNQSAIGLGLITETDLESIHREMNRQLAEEGAVLDAIYHCPVTGSGGDRTLIEHPDRKPGPGMLLRAADEHHLDLGRSWMVGDMISDVRAGRNAGCRGSILVLSGPESRRHSEGGSPPFEVASDLPEAVDRILATVAAPHDTSLLMESHR